MKSMEQWVVHRISSKKCKSCCENFDFLTKKKFRRKLGIFRMLFAFFAKFRFYLLREKCENFAKKQMRMFRGENAKILLKN